MKFEELLNQIKRYNFNGSELITKAYNFANSAHYNQLRESGQEYIIHSLGAAKILADLKMDEICIAACLLHDVLEDTNISKEILKNEFGEEIANIVENITKISKLTIPDFKERQVENLRKMLIASTKDIRVILIKLADRLDNIHSLKYLREDKQKRIAQETLEIYAPIAYRLGLANIKWQLEDLAFRYLEPKIYQEIKEKVAMKRREREIEVNKIKVIIERELRKRGLNVGVVGRAKSFYSIYKKIVERGYSFEGMFDLIALRIVVNDIKECYEVLGIIHNLFTPIDGSFKDYIANPKPNGYQSLHTVVLFNNKKVEIQIRTRDMDEIAEEGVAAHWRYKKLDSDKDFEKRLGLVKQIFNIKDVPNKEFLNALKFNLFEDHIFVFTPKHDIIEIPQDATVLDFAYSVHTDLGNHCVGARVNGKFVSIKHELQNGDTCEVLIAKNQNPSREWLKIVKSQKARDRIIHALKIRNEIPVSKLKKINAIKPSIINCEIKTNFIKIANCCNPLPKDEIIGLANKNNKVTVHKVNCSELNNKKLRKIKVFWNDESDLLVNIKIIAYDRIGLFADILSCIASSHINIEKADAKSITNDIGECNIKIKINSLQELTDTINKIKDVADIKKISLT